MAALGNMLKEGFMNTVKWLWSSISESNVISKMVFGNDKSLMANILGTFLKLATAALLGAILGGMIGGPLGAAIGARAGLAIGGYAMASNRFGGGGGGSAPAAATGAGGLPVSVEVIGPDNQQLRVNQYKSADKQRVIISSEGTDFTGEIQ